MNGTIDLNADLGEGCAFDAELMSVVTSCNIACGGHAGDAETMRTALALAKQNQVVAGAHPSFPDRENFGRTRSDLSGPALEAALSEQVRALKTLAEEIEFPLAHLKPHGALYNMAATDAGLAASICKVLQSILPRARLVGPPESALQAQAEARGIAFTAEGFADRAYQKDRQLRDRKLEGAVLHDADEQVAQATDIALNQRVRTHDGEVISLPVQTICVHGDTPGAFAAAKAIRTAMESHEIKLCPPD
nr:5-oxoprolinase subunit PxpA [Hyphomonas sp. Mor2]